MRRPFPTRRIVIYSGLSIFYVFLLLPIAWLVLSSFRNSDSVQSGRLLPTWSELTFRNYVETFQISNFVTYLVNSCVIAFTVMILTVFLGSLGAYALSRFALKGKKLFMMLALLPQFFPYVLILIPCAPYRSGTIPANVHGIAARPEFRDGERITDDLCFRNGIDCAGT